jgi:hypothetical protein
MNKAISALVGTGTLLVTSLAAAQYGGGGGWQGSYTPTAPPPRSSGLDNLGAEGQVVIGVDRVMGVSFDSFKADVPAGGGKTVETKGKSTTFALFGNAAGGSAGASGPSGTALIPRLALDYFVMEGLSVGGSFMYMSTSTSSEVDGKSNDGPTTSAILFHPRVGYAMAFDETFSFWPRLGVTYLSSKTTVPQTSGSDHELKWHGFEVTAEANLGISPFSNFAFLIGPFLEFPLSGSYEACQPDCGDSVDTKLTSYGLSASVVGYFGN